MVGFDPETKTVYQYHGCHWEGCIVCFTGARQRKTIFRENVTYKQHIKKTILKEKLKFVTLVLILLYECPEEDVLI